MIQIEPLPQPRKPAPVAPAPKLKPASGRTPMSRWLRAGATKSTRKP